MHRRPDPGRCPDCRERVTPFAAGCALCGADLDPTRWHPRPTVAGRLRMLFDRCRTRLTRRLRAGS